MHTSRGLVSWARQGGGRRARTALLIAGMSALVAIPLGTPAQGAIPGLDTPATMAALQVPPYVDAGPDQSITLADSALLIGAIGDVKNR